MQRLTKFSRRRFVKLAGGASLLGAGVRLGWAGLLDASPPPPKFACVGTRDEIHVYAIALDGRFLKKQTIASARPVAMAIRNGNLYVANGISEHGNLPRGSVQAFAIDRINGRLQFINRVPLSLSATSPRDLAVSPDGRSLIVAVHGGGAYNVLPLDERGGLGRVSGILKETGSGPHASQASAHPAAVVFDRMGHVLAADQGSDRMTVLSLSDGAPEVMSRLELPPGSGPGSIVLHPDGNRVFVMHTLNASLSSFSYDPAAANILACRHTVAISGAGEDSTLAMHPSGEFLYSSHREGIYAWKIASDGSLQSLPGVAGIQAGKLHLTADGRSLLALSSNAVFRMTIERTTIHAATPSLSAPIEVASLSQPLSITTW